ncbi:low molecular weight phosphotyrosine protein phosphatase [Maribius pontilimi]|uniref:protein-tyrosine-phosphatase n=1 Tax=Palleronia pontilimi TaxID=1964209 RepID=A0A934MHJ8_9RHOB|nr:low molecular weight protein-tyrosine-phosphatase [Palleronia pontilimi]MBJ3763384.1 low molecular weight phosphotyrosine protein phosphatase [Palleronia pontilimi]
MTRILIVCLGNICRSPTAEAVLRAKLAAAGIDARVDSAGTGSWHVGDPPHADMQRAAERSGYAMGDLRARQVTPDDFERFDLILAADPTNMRDLEAIRPDGNATPVRLLAPYAGTDQDTVPDPYYTGGFDTTLELIEKAADGLIAQLQ